MFDTTIYDAVLAERKTEEDFVKEEYYLLGKNDILITDDELKAVRKRALKKYQKYELDYFSLKNKSFENFKKELFNFCGIQDEMKANTMLEQVLNKVNKDDFQAIQLHFCNLHLVSNYN